MSQNYIIHFTVRHFKWQVSVLAFNNRIDSDLNTDEIDYLHSAEGSVGIQSESLMEYSEYGTSGDIIQGFHEYKQLDRSEDNTLYEEYSTLKENYALASSEGMAVNPEQNIDEIEDIGILRYS